MALPGDLSLPVALPFNYAQFPLLTAGLRMHSSFSPPSCACTASNTVPPIATIPTQWPEFAKRVSGEWDGFGADFSCDGKALQLPESVVPEAFREWEVEVYDWQTQCPTLAIPDDHHILYRNIKLLPTVGCEADAATRYSIKERNPSADAHVFAYHSSGSFVAVWPLSGSSQRFELEHCLVNPSDPESRIRIILTIDVVPGSPISLAGIAMFSELWYGPFRNGDQLGGCAIGNTAFASTAPLDGSLVTGSWQGPSSVAKVSSSQDGRYMELVGGHTQKTIRDTQSLILLPSRAWCSVSESGADEAKCEVGWLVNDHTSISCKCIFSGDSKKLKEIWLAQEIMVKD